METIEADVVIVGGGITGWVAAIAAAEKGLNVPLSMIARYEEVTQVANLGYILKAFHGIQKELFR